MMSRPLLALLLATPLAACTAGDITGGGGGDDGVSDDSSGDDVAAGPDASVQDFSVSMSPTTVATTLGTENHYTVTLDSSHFSGPVTLTATGVPAGWNVTFSPSATVTVPEDGQVTADMTVAVPTDVAGMNANVGVMAQAAPGQRSATGALNVANEYDLIIPDGTKNTTHPFPSTLRLKVGVTLKIKTLDSQAPHRIHSDGGDGFPHQDTDMTNGQSYDVTPTDTTATYHFYCHDHGEGLGATNLTMVP
jgi:hypothetical protein